MPARTGDDTMSHAVLLGDHGVRGGAEVSHEQVPVTASPWYSTRAPCIGNLTLGKPVPSRNFPIVFLAQFGNE